MIVLVQGCLEGGTGGQLSLGPQPNCGLHLRNNDRNNRIYYFYGNTLTLSRALLKSGRVHVLRAPFRGILNALEYYAPVFSGGGQEGGNPGE